MNSLFASKQLPKDHDVLAPDGSEVRILTATPRGSMAHFRLNPGEVSKAVAHRTVEEVWYILAGQGRMWRKLGGEEEVTQLRPGTSLTIPVGTSFQFSCEGTAALEAVAVTMPPWPGPHEAYEVKGKW
jgi:mannose-6-phosphate isomerase-like protein (cupin superfamily)